MTSMASWQVLIALLPFLLVLYHSLNLWRRRLVLPEDANVLHEVASLAASIKEHYGWKAIVARYVLPAALIPIVGLVEFRLIYDSQLLLGLSSVQRLVPFEYGLAGAYFFVFLEFGKRSVRNDITPVSILWCLITLTIGPALASLIPSVFEGTLQGSWNDRALWIFAGYSPRLVFRTLSHGVVKSLHVETGVIQEERKIPLGRICGIGPEEMERLAEEGIKDAHALACVEPVRLMRDTRFDNWSILSWLDQALLLSSIPENIWRELLKQGYWGATDVKILVRKEPPSSPVRVLNTNEAEEILNNIADAVKVNRNVVRDMLVRLVQDPRTEGFQQLGRALAGWPAQQVATNSTAAPNRAPQVGRLATGTSQRDETQGNQVSGISKGVSASQ